MERRRHPTHGVFVPTDAPVIVFVTVCTRGRRRVLASERAHASLQAAWRAADSWQVGRYVIMPDHVHLFAAPTPSARSLEQWVRFWKSQFTRTFGQAVWQTDHWDRRLRDDDSYAQKWNYVRLNPVRHQLCERTEDWPYQGEIQALRWFDPAA